MLRVIAGLSLIAVAGVGGYLLLEQRHSRTEPETLIERYCIDCHNANDFAGGLRLDDKRLAGLPADAEAWEHVVRKLRSGMMPPADAPRPARDTLDAMTIEIEQSLDAAAAETGTSLPRTALRRLNRTEYANAIRDLLHLEVDPATLLPLDDSSEGFDNVASALGVSPSLVEAWVSTAMKLSRRALGDRSTPQSQITYSAPQRLAQDRHLEGMPLGTRGGLSVEHEFPLDADYTFRVRTGFRLPRTTRAIFSLDGVLLDVESRQEFTIPVSAGPHRLTAALIDTQRPAGVDDIYDQYTVPGSIGGIEIDGPIRPTGVGDTPSRRRILICTPASGADERPCAARIVATLAERAFRRPQSPETLTAIMEVYDQARADGDFETAIQHALARILVDPRFLYRIESSPATVAPGEVFAIDDYALATRLSFFLWSSIPDDALLARAGSGKLGEPDVLEAEIERMLADPRAAALVENFAAQWLFLRELDSVTPDSPDFDDNLRRAMIEETQHLFAAIVQDDLSVLRLLDADFTYLNDRLAEHYGIEGVHGSYFRRVELPPSVPRRGLLGHASILTLTSVTSRTSPVIRGRWILETLLGSPAPVPPPNVETTLEGDDGIAVATTVRERLEAHRANPTCASCHAIMDPIGFSLEQFDLIGAFRESDNGEPIDTSAALVDGTRIDGPAALREALLGRSEAFVTAMTEKLMTYALGRGLEYTDMPTVRKIVHAARQEDYRFSALLSGIVHSEPFLHQVKGAGEQ
ncbi:MAG: DUF1592 domain-containing protein [Gammaproteobacteria bacterium]|jgi:hypothetical protein